MPKFNNGDRVKVSLDSHSPYKGQIGVVVDDNSASSSSNSMSSSDLGYMVRFEWRGLRPTARFMEEELEAVSADITPEELYAAAESAKRLQKETDNQIVHVSTKRKVLFSSLAAVLVLIGALVIVLSNGAGKDSPEPSGFTSTSANLSILNQGSSAETTKLVFETQLVTATAGVAFPIQPIVKIVDVNGEIVTDSTASVTLVVTNNAEDLYGTTTVNAVNGVATFSDLFICIAGYQYKLTAISSGSTPVYSNIFAVAPGAASKLDFAVEPYGSGLNQNFSTIVSVKDVYGNIVTGSTAEVTLSITPDIGPAGAVLSGVTTQKAANGLATFNYLSITPADNYYKLTATSPGLRPAETFSFNAEKISKVEITQ